MYLKKCLTFCIMIQVSIKSENGHTGSSIHSDSGMGGDDGDLSPPFLIRMK